MSSLGGADLNATSAEMPRVWIRPHYNSFNGIRGVAVLMVFFSHYGGRFEEYTSQTLWVGVDLFFVLSGFLITGILYDSLESPHYFRDFYVRRALRIFPVSYGFFAALFILTPLLGLHYYRNLLTFVFYVGNLVYPFTNLDKHDPTTIWIVHFGHRLEVANIGILWSLCVEEQFYLIWPAIIFWVRRRSRLMTLCVVVSALTLVARFVLRRYQGALGANHFLLYWSTYTRWDSLLIGAWLALFLRGRALSRNALRKVSMALFGVSAVVLIAGRLLTRGSQLDNPFLMTAGYTLTGLASAGILLYSLDDAGWLSRVLQNRWLSGLGVISYGFYVYHAIPGPLWLQLTQLHPALKHAVPFAAFTLTVAFSWLSFRFYEKPFLRLKSKLAPQRPARMTAEGVEPAHLHLSEPRV